MGSKTGRKKSGKTSALVYRFLMLCFSLFWGSSPILHTTENPNQVYLGLDFLFCKLIMGLERVGIASLKSKMQFVLACDKRWTPTFCYPGVIVATEWCLHPKDDGASPRFEQCKNMLQVITPRQSKANYLALLFY